MSRIGYPLIRVLGIEGKKCDIIPTSRRENGMNATEIYSKKESCLTGYMGTICYDKKWKKYVLIDLHKDFQMSIECLKEAFEMTKKYWEEGGKK